MAERRSWLNELPKHPIFEELASESEEHRKDRRSKHIFIERDGEIFLWISSKGQLLTTNLKNLHFENERARKFQTLLCTEAPIFQVHTLLFSITAKYLALIGDKGVMVLEMPQRWGKFAAYDGGLETVNCRTISLDGRFYTAHRSVKILDAKWHPGSASDIQLVVLTSDNKLRMYSVLKPSFPEQVFSLGDSLSSTAEYSRKSMTSSSSFAAALGETATAFDFAPCVSVWPNKRNAETELAYPMFILQENGDIYYLLHGLTKSAQLMGPLTMHPAAEDNYGQDACSILCLHTQPPVVAMATTSGKIYHCIVVESEDQDHSMNGTLSEHSWNMADSPKAAHSPPDLLYVHECIELQLSFTNESLDKFLASETSSSAMQGEDESENPFPLRLHKDPRLYLQYHCTHNSGVHSLVLPWAKKLERFCSKDTPSAEGFDPEEAAVVYHMICTTPAANCPPAPVQGFCMINDKLLGSAIACLTSNMECVTRSTSLLDRHLRPASPTSEDDNDTIENMSPIRHFHAGSFENHIKSILKRNTSTPLFRAAKSAGDLSQQDCYQFLIQAQQVLRKEYIQKQNHSQEEIIKRMSMIKEQKKKQSDDLQRLKNSRDELKEKAEALACGLTDIGEKHRGQMERLEAVFQHIQTGIPVLSDAERRMKGDLHAIKKKLGLFQDSLSQIGVKREFWSKQPRRKPVTSPSINSTQQKIIKGVLQEESVKIVDLVNQLKDLTLQVGM